MDLFMFAGIKYKSMTLKQKHRLMKSDDAGSGLVFR